MATSMAMALQALGQTHCDEDTVNKVMGAQPMKGASWENALACAQHFGMRATLTSPCTVKQLKAWTDAGTPVLIAWNPEGREWSHASLVFDVDDEGNVWVADPNIPDPDETVRMVSKAEFYSKWSEKWPNYLVRRPAMAIEREITVDGRQVQAGKKEQRAQKDKGMSRFLKNGPVHPTEKSDSAKAMDAAQWELRKEQGTAGLPGSGMGAGFHKDKSRYDRGEGKRVDREASFQPRGLMAQEDYSQILRYAADLPPEVEEDVADIMEKNPDYSESQAWATAWSIHCKHRDPGSEHCQKPSSEYFKEGSARVETAKFEKGVSMTVDEVANVVGPEFKEMNENPPPSVVKVMEEMQGKTAAGRTTHLATDSSGFTLCGERAYRDTLVDSVRDATCHYCKQAWAKLHGGRMGSEHLSIEMFADLLKDSKFEKGKSVPVSELPEELQDNVTNPPPSVKKLTDELKGKQADLSVEEFSRALTASTVDLGAVLDFMFNSFVEEGAGGVKHLITITGDAGFSKALAKKWLEVRPDLFNRHGGIAKAQAVGESLVEEVAKKTGVRVAKFEEGTPADPTENMSEADAAEWRRQNEEHKDKFKGASTPLLRSDDENNAVVENFFHKSADMSDLWVGWVEDPEGYMVRFFPPSARGAVKRQVTKIPGEWEVMSVDHALKTKLSVVAPGWVSKLPSGDKAELNAFLDMSPVRVAGTGLYGFNKMTESACGAGVSKLQKAAKKIAAALYARDESSPSFLTKHAAKGGSKTAALLLKAMESIGPMAQINKTAAVNKWKVWTGPVAVKEVAKALKGVSGFSDVSEGTEHVLFKYDGDQTDLAVAEVPAVVKPYLKGKGVQKTAGRSGTGLYGFPEKTAKLGLSACNDLRHEAGVIAGDLFARKGADPVKVSAYLASHAKTAKCPYAAMLGECSPDIDPVVTAKKKATDFLASDEGDDEDDLLEV
jgi:hypothetical protein